MSYKKIIVFFLITYLWAWIFWLPFVLPHWGFYEVTDTLLSFKMPIMVVGASAPMISAIILIFHEGGFKAVKDFFKKCFNLKIKPIYIIVAIVISIIPAMIAHYLPYLLNLERLPTSYFPVEADLPIFLVFFIYVFVMFLIGGGQEEFGWRGYIQEPLQERLGIVKGSMLLGLFWGLWHYPLWLMPSESHAYYSFIGFVLFAISFSLLIGIMYNASGKKFVVAWVMHAISNLSLSMFPVFFMKNVPQIAYWVFVVLSIMITIMFTALYKKRGFNLT